MTDRETAIFACFTDTVTTPEPLLPPVAQTDAVEFFADWMAIAPRLNAAGLRAALHMLDVAPLTLGFRRRLRKLDREQRTRFLQKIERHRAAPVRQAVKALKGMAFLCYYGDDRVMKQLGYDAGANVQRARALRAAEGRP